MTHCLQANHKQNYLAVNSSTCLAPLVNFFLFILTSNWWSTCADERVQSSNEQRNYTSILMSVPFDNLTVHVLIQSSRPFWIWIVIPIYQMSHKTVLQVNIISETIGANNLISILAGSYIPNVPKLDFFS